MRTSLMIAPFVLLAASPFPAYAQASIDGSIRFHGAPPKEPPHQVTRDHDFCGRSKPNEIVLVSQEGGLANVVISVDGAPRGNALPKDVVVANEQCRFVPHVSAAMTGSALVVQNRDPLLHNTHVYLSDGNTFFNVAFPFKGGQIKRTLPKPDVMTFKCDVGHVWMSAYVHIFAHPFFAVSDASGNFKIEGLPPGEYTLKAWHEKLGTQTQQIKVATGINRAEFSYRN